MNHPAMWGELALRLVAAGATLTAIGSGLGLLGLKTADRVQKMALVWALIALALLMARFVGLADPTAAVCAASARLQYCLVLLQVPIVLHLIESPADPRVRRWALLSTVALAFTPWLGSSFAGEGFTVQRDALGLSVRYAEVGPLAPMMIPYGFLVGAYVAWRVPRYRGPDADLVRTVLFAVVLSVIPAGTNDMLMTLGVIRSVLLGDVACCTGVLGLSYVLSRRAHAAHQRLLAAVVEQKEELRRGDPDHRTTSRIAELGVEVARVVESLEAPLSRIQSAIADLEDRLQTVFAAAEPVLRDEATEILAESRDAARRLSKTVTVFEDFARAREPRTASVDLVAVLERALSVVGNEIRHRAALVRRFEGPLPIVVDPDGLVQALVGVLIRAVYAIPISGARTGRIVVAASSRGGRAVVVVSDNGTPIPAEDLPRVFDPYVAMTPYGEGTGFGLALCHRTVTGLGGVVSVETGPEGTRVSMDVPASGAAG